MVAASLLKYHSKCVWFFFMNMLAMMSNLVTEWKGFILTKKRSGSALTSGGMKALVLRDNKAPNLDFDCHLAR